MNNLPQARIVSELPRHLQSQGQMTGDHPPPTELHAGQVSWLQMFQWERLSLGNKARIISLC